ncbi:MAG: hypothetical protein AAB353_10825 [Candidatus Hydrogenedentota bacterium]
MKVFVFRAGRYALAAGALAILSNTAFAHELSGVWSMELDSPAGPMQVELTIGENGEGSVMFLGAPVLLGTVALDQGKVTFKTNVEYEGEKLVAEFDGMFDGAVIRGTFHTDLGEAFAIVTRKVPANGVWDLEVQTPAGALNNKLVLREDSSGVMKSNDTEITLKDVKMDDEKLSFSLDTEYDGQAITATFTGTISGDAIEGNFHTELGDAPAQGKRVPLTPLNGDWKLNIDTPNGAIDASISVSPAGAITMTAVGANGIKVSNVLFEGSKLSFKMLADYQGQQVDAELSATVDSNSMDGTISSAMGDVAFTGRRGQ